MRRMLVESWTRSKRRAKARSVQGPAVAQVANGYRPGCLEGKVPSRCGLAAGSMMSR